MKASLSALSIATLVAGSAGLAAVHAHRVLVEPDKILEIAATSLTTYLPPTATTLQTVRPRVGQRGTQIDGAVRAGTGLGLAIGGNPFAHGSGTSVRGNGLRLDQGAAEIFDVDLRLPSTGVDWVVGRSYNARQTDSGGTHLDSAGYQGRNWFQISNPEVLLYDDPSDGISEGAGDILYLVYGADRFIEFKRIGDGKTVFRAVNGAAGVVKHNKDATSQPGTFVYTDQVGNQTYFFDTDADAGAAGGQLWKVVDPAGNTAYFGDATTASTAITAGYSTGKPALAYDASNRRYTYSYSGSQISQVVAEILTSGTWTSSPVTATVGKVEYSYHDGTDGYGTNGDLKVVKITTPLTDSGVDLVQRKYYRYWKSTFVTTTNPGRAHAIKLIVGFDGCRKYDFTGDATFDEDFLAETTANLEPYAEAYFEYDSSERVVKSYANGGCGCGGGSGNGVYTYEYETNPSYSDNTAGYDEDEWYGRTIVKRPDNAYETHYYDEAFQPLSHVLTSADPDGASDLWATYVDRNSAGIVAEVSTPANVTAYTHSSGTPAVPVGTFTRSTSAGLVWTYSLVGSSYTTEGFATDRKFKEAGTSGTAYFDRTWTYGYSSYQVDGAETKSQVVRPVVATDREYASKISSGTTGSNLWTYTYTWHGASGTDLLALARLDTTEPAVTTAKNGSNASNVTRKYWNKEGTLGFEKTGLGYITYHGYTNGQQVTLIEDADTAHSDFTSITIPTNFTSTGTELHRKSTATYDNQGRAATSTANSYTPKRYYSRLKDQRPVTLGFTNSVAGSPTTYYGPVSYDVRNQAGGGEVSGVIGLTGNSTTAALTALIDETDDDPITAVDTGTVKRLSTNHYDSTGRELAESRSYFSIPASEPGTDGTHYDPTTYVYDDMGHRIRTEAPHGTVNRTDYDIRGHVTASWIGMNDNGYTGGDTTGTADMVKTSSAVFDAGVDEGNGYVTTRTSFVQDSTTDQRVTTYTNDARGRVIVEARPATPHLLHTYDNLGRRTASALMSSTSGLTSSSDATTVTTNRLALSETSYDEIGQVWRTIHHKIDTADGSDDDTLYADTWYDADRQIIKVDGSQLVKSFYDRLGRQTHNFTLARVTDSTYADADDLTSDIVLAEQQTTYDSSDGNVVMTALIQRFHDDQTTTGALDTNADSDALVYTSSNVKGRIQISASWNGLQGVSDSVEYGSYGGSTFTRSALSVPSRSTTALRTSYAYNEDGTLATVQDPTIATSHVTKYEYDAAGRKTKEIRHYDATVNSGGPSGTDDNVTTKWAYTDGLMTMLTADVPTGADDQQTLYTYGTIKGTSAGTSKIATGHLLKKVCYPDGHVVDAADDDLDVVKYAYNAQAQEIWHRDQEPSGHTANVIQTTYDDNGRQIHRRVTTPGTGFDADVLRITTTYTDLGQVLRVRQYDNATPGSGTMLNDVKFTYNDWGLISKYEEDRNGAVDGSGSVDDYGVTYAYAKSTGGRNAVRKTSMAMNHGTAAAYKTASYEYVTTGSYDNDASRVTKVKDDTVVLAAYEYLGSGSVVGTDYPQASVMSQVHTNTPGDYADFDRFNRPTTNKWTKDLATDRHFFNTTIAWDEAGNVTSVDEGVHAGFDVKYTMDDLDRVVGAQEGTLSGGSIGTETREQEWTLTHTGNWGREKLDLNGDGDWGDTDEHDDTRTHNAVNELGTQDLDSTTGTTGNNYTLTYDPAGNLTDDAQSYEYVYDAFYRLRKIKNTTTQALVEELTYNGLGHLIGEHYDTDTDGDVDANDKWYYTAYDERWRGVGTFRESDTTPKEIFWLQQAGDDGNGGSSYINGVVTRYKDANTAWTTASDGTLEQVNYYAQNWRGDVTGLVDDTGKMTEWVKYSAHGVPFGMPKGDADSDGDCDSTDANAVIQGLIDTSAYDVRGDIDLDGDVDASDKASALGATSDMGLAVLSTFGNATGYGGYREMRGALALMSAQRRLFSSRIGVWNQRDPLGYVDGASLLEYCQSRPITTVDPAGTIVNVLAENKADEERIQRAITIMRLCSQTFRIWFNTAAGHSFGTVYIIPMGDPVTLDGYNFVPAQPPGNTIFDHGVEPRRADGLSFWQLYASTTSQVCQVDTTLVASSTTSTKDKPDLSRVITHELVHAVRHIKGQDDKGSGTDKEKKDREQAKAQEVAETVAGEVKKNCPGADVN